MLVNTGSGNDYILVNPSVKIPVSIDGGSGDDVIIVHGVGPVTIRGGSGNDYIETDSPNIVLVDGGDGIDIIHHNGTTPGVIRGGSGDDTITSDSSTDTIYGDAGDDIITVHGNDTIYLGTGNDVVRIGPDAFGSTIYGNDDAGDRDFLVFSATEGSDIVRVERGSGAKQINITTNGKTLTTYGVEDANLSLGLGSDTITITDLIGGGMTSLTVSFGKRVTVNGTKIDKVDMGDIGLTYQGSGTPSSPT